MESKHRTTYRADSSSQAAILVRIAVVQPPAITKPCSSDAIQAAGLAIFDQAVVDSAAAGECPDIVCLPEYLNCMNHLSNHDENRFGSTARDLLDDVAARARAARCHVILPLIIDEDGKRYNRAYVINRKVNIVGHFDKVHVTAVEQAQYGIVAGSDWPVFDLDFGRIGIMICYDGCFSESSRIIALQGAQIIFWPSLQRSYTRDQLELQTRSHAYFNYTTVARSSYGGPFSPAGDHCMVGFSCVCAADGTILTSIEGEPGWTAAQVDLDNPPRGARTFGGMVGNLREMRFEDRRPDKYDLISRAN